MKRWIVAGRVHCSKEFILEVEEETPHDAAVHCKKCVESSGTCNGYPIPFLSPVIEYSEILIVREKKP